MARELAFWTGGQREALQALRAAYAARNAELERELARAPDEAERLRLRAALAQLRAELLQRERDLRGSLFGSA